MGQDDKIRYESLPIPTYEEATSSRPSSSQTLGPEEISDDAEREGLLYHAPTAESPRPSEDSENEATAIRRSMEQMDVMEPEEPRRPSIRDRLRNIRIPRIPSIPEKYRVSLPIIARLVALFTLASLVYALFAFNMIPNRGRFATRFDPESVRSRVQSEADAKRIGDYLEYITSFDHVAGTEGDFYLSEWVSEMWQKAELDKVQTKEYFVYLNYPTQDGRGVAIVDPPEKRWVARLEEEATTDKQQTLIWHGSSRSGNVTGPLIYANGGSRHDFAQLKEMGIDVKGAVVLVRYYHTQDDRASKVKAAEVAGAAGCIIYSDPKEDGFLRGKPMPDGPFMPSDGVQRGSVALSSFVVGDALTPGWASTEDAKRIDENNNPGLVNIPSIPLSWRDAQVLLQSIEGHGKKVEEDWIGGVPEVKEWWTGDSSSPIVNLMNMNDENKKQRIWNVHGSIQGMETSSEKIIVGNHRDSWCFGSVDPGSGSAVLMEVVNIFGTLKRLGWRPLRTIEFVSWDAEEYNFIGSTEYVEEHMLALRQEGVAYLNVDVGVSGPNFQAAASPLFIKPLMHVLDRVSDPITNVTLRQLWDENNSQLPGLAAGSDYVAFQDMAGISSIDFGFEGPENGYPYHSCYESFEWMTKYGDPGFQYHKTLAQVWALLILEIADRPIIPYDLKYYAQKVNDYITTLDTKNLNVQPLKDAADVFTTEAGTFHEFDDFWAQQVLAGSGGFETDIFALKRIGHNQRTIAFETNLLDIPENGEKDGPYGIPGREQYKHILFGPQAWSGYDEAYFPAIQDAIEEEKWEDAQRLLERAARILKRAAQKLNS
ncbi:hypothetical protein AAFC00_001576 [Neodothiora populina]|uniref:Glutamate carboxypeptidase n=1 Tax=Neodothiora populina TaxID=2781224 RepID=A0ABR3PPE7_9PEZI